MVQLWTTNKMCGANQGGVVHLKVVMVYLNSGSLVISYSNSTLSGNKVSPYMHTTLPFNTVSPYTHPSPQMISAPIHSPPQIISAPYTWGLPPPRMISAPYTPHLRCSLPPYTPTSDDLCLHTHPPQMFSAPIHPPPQMFCASIHLSPQMFSVTIHPYLRWSLPPYTPTSDDLCPHTCLPSDALCSHIQLFPQMLSSPIYIPPLRCSLLSLLYTHKLWPIYFLDHTSHILGEHV